MFQILEIDALASDPQNLRKSILTAVDDGSVAVFRGGGKRFTLDEWSAFLSKDCGFLHDRRHYNFSSSLELQDWWEISYQPEKAVSYAYSKTRQPLHNDNAWFSDPAEVNMFVMKKQAREGGVNFFYPVERLVADLQAEEPGLFHDLTHVPVVIKKGGGEHFNRTTIIIPGPAPRVFWNYHRTEKPDAAITQLCETFRSFLEKKEATQSVARVRSDSGDAFLFHDQKILHGRTAFTAEEPFERVLYQSMWRLL